MIPFAPYSGFLDPTMPPSHPPALATLKPSMHLPPMRSEYSCFSLFLSYRAASDRSYSSHQSTETGATNSLLVTSAPLGRFRASAGGIHQYAPRCLAGKSYVVSRVLFSDYPYDSSIFSHEVSCNLYVVVHSRVYFSESIGEGCK